VDDPTILKTTAHVRKVKTGVGLGQPGEGVLGRASYLQLGSFRLDAPTAACWDSLLAGFTFTELTEGNRASEDASTA
jgi:hypothetical protein